MGKETNVGLLQAQASVLTSEVRVIISPSLKPSSPSFSGSKSKIALALGTEESGNELGGVREVEGGKEEEEEELTLKGWSSSSSESW